SLGVITNAINGAVSPGYFVRIMGWSPGPGIWAASVAQGIFEGAIFGLIFGILFTVVVAIASAARISFRFGFRFLAASVVGSLICWCLGGLLGLLMAWLSPDFFVAHFYRVPTETAERLRFAWAGGSIWGLELGGLGCMIVSAVACAVAWRALIRRHAWY